MPQCGVVDAIGAVIAPGHQVVAPHAFAQQVAEGGVGLDEAAHLAIGLGKNDFQVAATANAQVIDLVRAGGNVCGVDRVAVLQYFQLGPALGHAADHRRVALHHVWQHAHVGGQLYPFDGQAAEHIATAERFAQGQRAPVPRQVVLGVGVEVHPVLALAVVAPALAAAQAPAAQVDPAIEGQVLAAVGGAGVAAEMLRGGLVADEGGIDAVVPALWCNAAGHIPAQGDLRDGQRQLKLAGVQVVGGVGHQPGQVDAALVAGQWLGQALFTQTQFAQQAGAEAGLQALAIAAFTEIDFMLARRCQVDQHFNPVAAGRQGGLSGQGAQGGYAGVDGLAWCLAHEVGVELNGAVIGCSGSGYE